MGCAFYEACDKTGALVAHLAAATETSRPQISALNTNHALYKSLQAASTPSCSGKASALRVPVPLRAAAAAAAVLANPAPSSSSSGRQTCGLLQAALRDLPQAASPPCLQQPDPQGEEALQHQGQGMWCVRRRWRGTVQCGAVRPTCVVVTLIRPSWAVGRSVLNQQLLDSGVEPRRGEEHPDL